MKIQYSENCRLTIEQIVPCAIVRTRDGLLIDRTHPRAKELTEIVFDMMDNVETLDADGEKGLKLLDRVAELSSWEASTQLSAAWSDMIDLKRKAAAERKAQAWVSKWAAIDPDERPYDDTISADFLVGLCDAGNKALSARYSGGLRAVFAYGYQRGKEDAERKEASV